MQVVPRVAIEPAAQVARLKEKLVGNRFGAGAVAANRATVVEEQREGRPATRAREQEEVRLLDLQPAARDGARDGKERRQRA